ncbi:MAG: hypothetical protein JWO85_3461 [Candidatus Eremiobacteraeota bacterium]|nr:hypothetical protein [Candidatus Eremiobacteraeota bacterium]
MEPARHQIAAATKAIDEALKRTSVPEDLARAALVAAANAGDVVIPTPLTLDDLAENQWPEAGAIVYLTSYDERNIISARVTARDPDGCRFKLSHPDSADVRVKGIGRNQWFEGYDLYGSAQHAYFALATEAEGMRQAVEESIMDEQRLRDRLLAAAEDADVAALELSADL